MRESSIRALQFWVTLSIAVGCSGDPPIITDGSGGAGSGGTTGTGGLSGGGGRPNTTIATGATAGYLSSSGGSFAASECSSSVANTPCGDQLKYCITETKQTCVCTRGSWYCFGG